MAVNLTKRYNEYLDLMQFNEFQRTRSLRAIFDRDIADNDNFKFQTKVIRPLKREDVFDVESLFDHLTKKSIELIDSEGKKIKSRSLFDIERSKRLHWIWHHIQEKKKNDFEVFSCLERKKGKDVIQTYLLDVSENYVIVLEPQRSTLDYYLLSAYYIDEKWGRENMLKKIKKKLPDIY